MTKVNRTKRSTKRPTRQPKKQATFFETILAYIIVAITFFAIFVYNPDDGHREDDRIRAENLGQDPEPKHKYAKRYSSRSYRRN